MIDLLKLSYNTAQMRSKLRTHSLVPSCVLAQSHLVIRKLFCETTLAVRQKGIKQRQIWEAYEI
jgi:hypothetical protein